MFIKPRSATVAAIALTVALAGTACGEQAQEAIREATAEARETLYEESIDLSRDGVDGKVELTPDGELLIDGSSVPMNAAQRQAALAYREKLLAVADAGLMVGEQGAALGGEAASLAIGALFGGKDVDAEETRRKIEAEAEKIKAAAMALCRDARALELEQTRFVEMVPEFAPYAKTIDIDADCEDGDGDSPAVDTVST